MPAEGVGARLDQYLARLRPEISRSQIKGLIEEGAVLVNGGGCKPGQRLHAGDALDLTPRAARPTRAQPEALPLAILFEDPHVIVVDKRAGMVVHPAGALVSGTLVNALLHRCPDLGPIGGEIRPGIVHRLDKETSGALVVAKNEPALVRLQAAFKARVVEKRYLALCHGAPPDEGALDTPYGRHPRDRVRFTTRVKSQRRARLTYRALERFPGATLLEVTLQTGRTHQIRVQLSEAGFPIVADSLYGGTRRESRLIGAPVQLAGDAIGRQALHARLLAFPHPARPEVIRVESPLPDDFRRALELLRSVG
ncbi:MAG: RluA family pseudouridine synthase [Deltaproteobacteria bacterium]